VQFKHLQFSDTSTKQLYLQSQLKKKMKKFLATYTSNDGAGIFAILWMVTAFCAITYLLAGTV